jgi:putative metalloprotease
MQTTLRATATLLVFLGCSSAMAEFSLGGALSNLVGGGSQSANGFTDAIKDLTKSASITDEEVNLMAKNFTSQSDAENQVAPDDSVYAKRLAKLTRRWESYDGMQLNYKVYQSDTVNAFALSNGTVRVYSGLMDLMTDDELRFVLGHEIAHVKLGHSAAAIKTAYRSSALVKGAAALAESNAQGVAVMDIAGEQLKSILEKAINASHSRGQESEADAYAVVFLKAAKSPTKAASSALLKLAQQSGTTSAALMSSHPDPADRAAAVEKMTAN